MEKNIELYVELAKKIKKIGGVGSRAVNLSHSKNDPLIKSIKKVEYLQKKL